MSTEILIIIVVFLPFMCIMVFNFLDEWHIANLQHKYDMEKLRKIQADAERALRKLAFAIFASIFALIVSLWSIVHLVQEKKELSKRTPDIEDVSVSINGKSFSCTPK